MKFNDFKFSIEILQKFVFVFLEDKSRGSFEEYQLPYQEYVFVEPTLDQMKKVVCEQQLRPRVLQSKLDDPVINEIPFLHL
jgi:hypothetical protein